MFVKSIRDR
ncbi:hypothetical protein V2J09_003509 [Rumex salicifolius]